MALIKPAYSFDDGGVVFVNLDQAISEEPIRKDRNIVTRRFGGTGKMQTNHRYKEILYTLLHEFETESKVNEMRTMMDFVLKGNSFKFYDDQLDTGTFVELEALKKSFSFSRMNKKLDIWTFSLNARIKI